jgi:O-antigen ligase
MQSEIFANRLIESFVYGNLGGREIIWVELLPLIKESPIIGVGETGYNSFALATFGMESSPHNVILEVFCYTGLVGIIIYILFQYQIFKRAYENYKTTGLLLPILLLIVAWGIIGSGQILYQKIGWCIFAYVAGSSLFKQKSKPVGGFKVFIKHNNSLRRR